MLWLELLKYKVSCGALFVAGVLVFIIICWIAVATGWAIGVFKEWRRKRKNRK